MGPALPLWVGSEKLRETQAVQDIINPALLLIISTLPRSSSSLQMTSPERPSSIILPSFKKKKKKKQRLEKSLPEVFRIPH